MMKQEKWVAYNYCIAFIDILGQREEYKNEGLIPNFASNQEREAFNQKIKNTIAPIIALQQDANAMMEGASTHNPKYQEIFPPDGYETYVKIRETKIKSQRWSDGWFYSNLWGTKILNAPLLDYLVFLALLALCAFWA